MCQRPHLKIQSCMSCSPSLMRSAMGAPANGMRLSMSYENESESGLMPNPNLALLEDAASSIRQEMWLHVTLVQGDGCVNGPCTSCSTCHMGQLSPLVSNLRAR